MRRRTWVSGLVVGLCLAGLLVATPAAQNYIWGSINGVPYGPGAILSGDIRPAVADGAAVGTATYPWSDLFLASGGVINWNNGDVTVTHAANALAFAGGSSGYSFDSYAISPTVYGSTADNGDLTLEGTSSATKTTSYVILQPTSGNVGIGTTTPDAHFQIEGNLSAAAWTTTGLTFDVAAATYTDTSTAAAGTVAVRTANSFGAPTFASTNAITVTDAFTLYVPKPIAGTNTTLTRANSAYFEGAVGIGATTVLAKLHLYSTSGFSDSNLRFQNNALGTNYWETGMRETSGSVDYLSFERNGGAPSLKIQSTGNIGVGVGAAVLPRYKFTTIGAIGSLLSDDGTNYEGLTITPTSGAVTLAAVTAGTGADNINIVFTPAGTGTNTLTGGITGGCSGTPTVATAGVATTCTGPEASPDNLLAMIYQLQAELASVRAELARRPN